MEKTDRGRYLSLHPQVAFRVVRGEGVVVLARDGQVEVVNEVGARVLEQADGSRGLQEIVDSIVKEFEVSPDQAWEDVREFVGQMVGDSVLEWVEQEG
jgi:hypothetical protein